MTRQDETRRVAAIGRAKTGAAMVAATVLAGAAAWFALAWRQPSLQARTRDRLR